MEKLTIDFANVKTLYDFYDAVIAGLKLPDWCGKGLDAIWDMVTGYMEYPVAIRLHGTALLPKELAGKMSSILEMFKEASDMYDAIIITLDIVS